MRKEFTVGGRNIMEIFRSYGRQKIESTIYFKNDVIF